MLAGKNGRYLSYGKNMKCHSFSQNLKIFREQRSYSQEKLAYESDLATRTIQLYERGDRNPSVSNLVKISQALNVKASQLYPDLKNINIIKIVKEKHEKELKAVTIFTENCNSKDLEIIDQRLYILKNSYTMDDHIDYACNMHKYLLKYTPDEYQLIGKKIINQSYQELFFNIILNDAITEKFHSIYFDIHRKLFQAILDRDETMIFSEYQNHLENEENMLAELTLDSLTG